jgi:outer membrane protein TolC
MKTSCAFLTVVLVVAVAVAAHAQNTADQQRYAEIAKSAAQQFANARADDQTRPTIPITTPGPNVELTLDDATARALEKNLDIAVERLNPELQDWNLARIRAAYLPTFTSVLGRQSRINAPTSTLNGGFIVDTDTNTYNSGFSQAVPVFGSNFSFQFNNNKQVSNNSLSNFNPAFNSNFAANYTQPLLRNLTIDNNRQQLRITQINRDISEVQLKGTIATTVASVRNSYWELLYAIQALEVAKGSLDLAQKLVADNKARVEVGTMAPLDVVQAEAEAATRVQAVAQAEATLQTSELALKRLIVSGTDDPLWRSSITPVDRPTFRSEAPDVETAVKKALTSRTDLDAARQTLTSNDITMKFLHNQTMPALDLTANYGAVGVGGTQFRRASTSVTAPVIETIPGGYSDAWSSLTARSYPNWNVALNLSYQIGNSTTDASYARAKVQRNQTAAQLRALELSVATEVTNAALTVQSSLKRYEASQVARELSETRLQAEQSRFEVGLSTNFFVVQAQRDLATAQNTELRALLDYRRAQVDFERSQETPANRGAGITAIAGGGGGGATTGGGQ